MIKIKASVIANQKMTYVQDNNACMQIDCSAGINDLLLPDCCRKLGLADYPKDNALIEELACYWKKVADTTMDMFLLGNGSQQLLYLVNKLLIEQGTNVLGYAPQYSSYCSDVLFCGGIYRACPMGENYRFELKRFTEQIEQTDTLIYLDNPNNPTGVVYSEETIKKLAAIMEAKQKEFGTDIVLISDEPYRELAYDGVEVPYLTKYYDNTVVGYSYSKSLSLPGERIGYLVIPDEMKDSEEVLSAANVATRILGFVNAPTLQQKVVEKCLNEKTDLSFYDRNREDLYNGLKECGFECIKPQGAFYLFVKSPVPNEKEFCEAAKKYNILIVPGSSFACPGYVRLAYCVSHETIINSLPKFKELAKEYF